MTSTYLITANVLPATPESRATQDDITAAIIGTLRPSATVEKVAAEALGSGVLFVAVWVTLAGEGEAVDTVRRIERQPGLPPIDAVTYRRTRRPAARR